MQTFRKYFIRFILSYTVREKIALLRYTANHLRTDHKLHFQPKHPLRAKLEEINNKNEGGNAEVSCRQFGSYLYHLFYHIRSGKRQICFVVPPTNPLQAVSSIFSPKIKLGPKLPASNNKDGCGTAEV